MSTIYGVTTGPPPGVEGEGYASDGVGVYGSAHGADAHGVADVAPGGAGVRGESIDGAGVKGRSTNGSGVYGDSDTANGVTGHLMMSRRRRRRYAASPSSCATRSRGRTRPEEASTCQGPSNMCTGSREEAWT